MAKPWWTEYAVPDADMLHVKRLFTAHSETAWFSCIMEQCI